MSSRRNAVAGFFSAAKTNFLSTRQNIPCAATQPMSKRESASPSESAIWSASPSGGFQSLSKVSTPPRIGIGGLASYVPPACGIGKLVR